MSEVAVSIPISETDTAKRQQILDGARRCFLAQGFDGASMNDIVVAAGVSKGTVYAYFPSKEKLFAAMVFEDKRRHAERLAVLGDETRPVAEVLRDVALRLVTLFQTPESLAYFRLVIAASAKFPEIGRTFYEAGPAYSIEKMAAYFQTKMDDGTLKSSAIFLSTRSPIKNASISREARTNPFDRSISASTEARSDSTVRSSLSLDFPRWIRSLSSEVLLRRIPRID